MGPDHSQQYSVHAFQFASNDNPKFLSDATDALQTGVGVLE